MNNQYRPDIADILSGSFIRYDRLYEMTKFAFYGKTDSNNVNIYIDAYSILRSIYNHGLDVQIKSSYVIASCLINLAIHLRAYFDSRHGVSSKVYIIYGGARPREAFVNCYNYNEKNILMEDSNMYMKNLIVDNLKVMQILCPYLYDIFCIVDYENEFSVITSSIINKENSNGITPNIIYTKDQLPYQLVAFKPVTFLYRPKKNYIENADISWVVTKSTLYNAFRYGELKITKNIETSLDPLMISIYQSICGVRDRNMGAIKNANSTIKILEKSLQENIFYNGYNANAILYQNPNPFEVLFKNTNINIAEVVNRFAAIDLRYQTMLFESSVSSKDIATGIINLYNPQEVRNINDKYFYQYPLDLNRV